MKFPGLWWQGGVPPPGAFGGPLPSTFGWPPPGAFGGPLPGAFGGPPPGAFRGQPPWGGVDGQFRGMEHATSVEVRTISAEDSTKQNIRTREEAGVAAMFVLRDCLFCSADDVQRNFSSAQIYCRSQQASHRHDHPPDSKHRHQRLITAGRAGDRGSSPGLGVYFQTFVVVLVAVIQQGQAESKGGISQGQRNLLIDEWQKISKRLRAYMNAHITTRSSQGS